jgi:adenylyltransferase/sulfurtransferase
MDLPGGPNFSEDEIQRYSRHILLDEVGGTGQARLRDARVLIVGAGGLGSPVLLYLAAAGVGTIGVVDDDVVELSNLSRQIAHGTADVGAGKVASALAAARAINPLVKLEGHAVRLDAANAGALVAGYEVVCDGSDSFATRAAVAEAARRAGRTLISAAVLRFEGQLGVFRAHDGRACYRCLYPEAPPQGLMPTCAQAGVLGAVAGVMGTLQAVEAIKEILGIGDTLAGKLLIWDALGMAFRTIALRRDPACPACGHDHSEG